MITEDFKKQIVTELKQRRGNFTGSNAQFAVSLGINAAQYSRINNGDVEKVLSDSNWIHLGRLANLRPNQPQQWKTAKTPFFNYVMTQLEFCQQNNSSRILCDMPDIGKSYTGIYYAKASKNTVYIDASQVKSKQKFVREIAKGFGLDYDKKYCDVYGDLVYYLQGLDNPLIIADEIGDLEYAAFLELKALWNATERCCAWYVMGADGLKHKMQLGINHQKVGYAELFSRWGNCFQRVSPEDDKNMKEFKAYHAAMIIKANYNGGDVHKLYNMAGQSLRRIPDVLKLQTAV